MRSKELLFNAVVALLGGVILKAFEPSASMADVVSCVIILFCVYTFIDLLRKNGGNSAS